MPDPRRLRDPRALTALAHPVRLGIIELLATEGPMTASQLADRLDESPANCSWHLRKLAEHAFIEEAEGGTGRQRPWQMAYQGLSWGEDDDASPEEQRAGEALARAMMERWVDRYLRADVSETVPAWREANRLTQTMGWLTVDELREVNDRVVELIRAYEDRMADPSARPEGSRLVEMVAWGAAVEVTR
ncbi:helix-turn-helix domain-containing protein [Nocardioides KLBMP 9356]|uniref:Helix-turn-helix domain-containing protein n=1 Tax=Nocardioides potassii TaxID=2911371 RepID=A0ABS9H874_9ACTN|nr:helix-turn-helix domain-containing protein [Nocardioides potassii]MCF6376223.1 helix-turn-helix domain-containing protein [Nocardioides potassii]